MTPPAWVQHMRSGPALNCEGVADTVVGMIRLFFLSGLEGGIPESCQGGCNSGIGFAAAAVSSCFSVSGALAHCPKPAPGGHSRRNKQVASSPMLAGINLLDSGRCTMHRQFHGQ